MGLPGNTNSMICNHQQADPASVLVGPGHPACSVHAHNNASCDVTLFSASAGAGPSAAMTRVRPLWPPGSSMECVGRPAALAASRTWTSSASPDTRRMTFGPCICVNNQHAAGHFQFVQHCMQAKEQPRWHVGNPDRKHECKLPTRRGLHAPVRSLTKLTLSRSHCVK